MSQDPHAQIKNDLLAWIFPAQVLMNVLSLHKNLSDSLTVGRLHPQLKANTVLVDGELSLFFSLVFQQHARISVESATYCRSFDL